MKIAKSHFTPGLIAAAVVTLTACGGGGSSPAASNINAAVPMTNKTITVMDGLIQNALVCVDSNSNGVCDATEIQGYTDAMGNVTLAIPTADLTTATLVAEIKAGVATDKDTGAIQTSYTLQTPAGTLDVANPVISPLTNMVQVKINADRAAGISTSIAAADRFVISQLGLSTTAVSAFDNFVAKSAQGSAQHIKAAERAHLLVVSTQASIRSASKGSDTSGAGDKSAQSIQTRVENNLLSQLPNVGTVSNIVEHMACATNGSTNVAQDCKTEIDKEVHNDHLDSVGGGNNGTTDTTGTTGSTGSTATTGTPATGTPATGTPATGTPATGTPATGTPATGTPATGTPATGTPATGTPATGTPAAGTPATAAALNGKVLYGMYCASCHGTSPNFDAVVLRGANSSVTISNAIYAVPSKSMGQLSGLSALDLANIAAYLATPGI